MVIGSGRKYRLLNVKVFTALLFLLLVGGCGKNVNVSWVYYDETICADRWDRSNNNEVLKDNITAYFKSKGVKIYELEIFTDRTPDSCGDCHCKTGRRIKAKVKNREVDTMQGEGFYK
jgi:hypothetical protein